MASAQPVKARPYRDFLTPSLHRRFTGAALWSLLGCYVLAIWWSSWSPFWSWFPLGPTGIRTLTLFICPLLTYILRVGNLHVGSLTTASPFETFYLLFARMVPLQVFAWYTLSALCFCELSIWASSEDARLGMIDHGRSYERSRLNERPIFLRTLFCYAAVVQSIVHMYYDDDRVKLPTSSASSQSSTLTQIRAILAPKAVHIPLRSLGLSISGLVVYFVFLRRAAFSAQYFIASKLYRIPKTRSFGIPGFVSLFTRYALHCLILLCIWEAANALCTVYLSKPPLKREQPLTNDSKDPNGSLISGLKGRKEFQKNMAFWELLLITRDFEMRRKSIFGEIDRQGGTTWAQISSICMAEIKTIKDRIEAFNRPAAPPAQATPEIQTLPRLSQPLRDDNVFTKPAPPKAPLDGAMDAFGNFAKAHGNAPGADPISPRARKLLEAGFTKLLPEGQKRPTSANVKESVGGILRDVLRSPFGTPYRQTFARRATAVICGSPISRSSSITVAIHALTQLITVSLKEDTYGCVQRDVLGIFRCFTTTVQSIEGFLRSLPPHWTDVEFKEQNRAEVEDVNELLQSLKGGLEGLLLVYGEYLQGLGAGGREVQAAKAMVAQGKPKEMIEAT